MTNRKIVLSYPDTNTDKEPFIKHHHKPRKHSKQQFTHLTPQQRHQQYIQSQPTCDKLLIKLEEYFKHNHISLPLISVICTGIAFFITFLCIIAFLSNHQTTKNNKSYHSLIHATNKHSQMTQTSNNIIKKIKILLISDIHLNKTNVAKVGKYLTSSKIKIDHLWAPGDFLNLPMEDMNDEKAIEQAENDLIELLKTIQTIHPNPIIIPGNHDPKTLFSTSDKYYKFGNCINIHNRIHSVNGETNLFMAGFGGSVPAFCDGMVKWNGYPFKNENEFGNEYNKFIDMIVNNKEIEQNNSVILFTHNGPSMCSTTMDWQEMNENKIITTGSVNIMKSMLNDKIKNKIFLNIHGHTHRGFGQGHIGNVRIINPGSLKGDDQNYNFALLYLVQLKDETWKVDSVQFKSVKDVQL